MNTLPILRGRDNRGAGCYGARRGGRLHRGVDCCSNAGEVTALEPGDAVRAVCSGFVSKVGYPYAHDLSFRYVEITDRDGFEVRHFYVAPSVQEGDEVERGEMIGVMQRLPYKGITQHWHLEVKRRGDYHDPLLYLCGELR